jgi:hypothetical protein
MKVVIEKPGSATFLLEFPMLMPRLIYGGISFDFPATSAGTIDEYIGEDARIAMEDDWH